MKTNKLGFLGLLTIIAFNYALMEKTPLQIIKQDTSRSIANFEIVSDSPAVSTTQAVDTSYTIEILGTISSEKDFKSAAEKCYSSIESEYKDSKTLITECYFLTNTCDTQTRSSYPINLAEAEKLNADHENLTKAKMIKNTKDYILTKITEGYASVSEKFCATKEVVAEAASATKEALPASRTDSVEAASNGQIPNQTTGTAAAATTSEVATASTRTTTEPSTIEYANVLAECSAIYKGVKSDRSRRVYRNTTASAADKYSNRDQNNHHIGGAILSEEDDYSAELIENAVSILEDEMTTKRESKKCIKMFKKSKNSELRTIAKDFDKVRKQEEKLAKEVRNSLRNYDSRAAFLAHQKNQCEAQARYMMPRNNQQVYAQQGSVYNRNQHMIQQVNQGAQQAFDAQMRNCDAQFNTNSLKSQYSNGLSNYMNNSTRYIQGTVQTSSAVSSYQSWVQAEITAMQNALGYNTDFTNPSFATSNSYDVYGSVNTASIQKPVVNPNVASSYIANNSIAGTSTLLSNQVTGSYASVTPQVARPNFAAVTNNATSGQIPRRPTQLLRR